MYKIVFNLVPLNMSYGKLLPEKESVHSFLNRLKKDH